MAGDDTPAERYRSLAEDRSRLQVLYDSHTRTAGGFLGATDTAYAVDLFLVGVIQRSLHLVQAFVWCFDHWNLVVAAPLVRLQLDNLTRVSYVAQHPDMHTLSIRTLEEEFRSMEDDQGKRLVDSRLVKHAKNLHPWLPGVYEEASGWIHLSPQLLMLPLKAKAGDPARIEMSVRHVIDDYPEELLAGVLGSMTMATGEVLSYASMWEYKKMNPTHTTHKRSD